LTARRWRWPSCLFIWSCWKMSGGSRCSSILPWHCCRHWRKTLSAATALSGRIFMRRATLILAMMSVLRLGNYIL